MEASVQWQQRKVADINDILQNMDLIARLTVQLTSLKDAGIIKSFWYMQGGYNKDVFISKDMTLAEIITEAKKLEEPIWIEITTICTDLIGKEVWIDKEIPIVVNNVVIDETNAVAITKSGRTFSLDSLWIKR